MEKGLRFKDKIFIAVIIVALLMIGFNKLKEIGSDKKEEAGNNSQEQMAEQDEIKQDENEMSVRGHIEKDVLKNRAMAMVDIAGNKLKAEVAVTDEKKYQGLSGREKMENNEGMLFVFDQSGYYSFVMREMNFALDFIFIRGNEVVGIKKNVPADYTESIKADEMYDFVLEVNAGWADEKSVLIGDQASYF